MTQKIKMIQKVCWKKWHFEAEHIRQLVSVSQFQSRMSQ